MKIKQFEYVPLAHFSYAIMSEGKIALVDPSRNPKPYYKYAEENNAKIVAIFETHLHADFVSSHLQIHEETGATIYISKHANAKYPHVNFDENDVFEMNDITFCSINTPGHSKEGCCIVAKSKNEKTAIFTGDTLFIGDVGRPDLHNSSDEPSNKREELAELMFHTIQHKFTNLPSESIIYPTHGSGSFCGKSLDDELISTLGKERKSNWAFQINQKEEFIEKISEDQPLIPSYFSFNVELNRKGISKLESNFEKINFKFCIDEFNEDMIIIDTRDESLFKNSHFSNSFNIMARDNNDMFETWLGTVVKPKEPFAILIDSVSNKKYILDRVAKIGYEQQLDLIFTKGFKNLQKMNKFCLEDFKKNMDKYTIVDIRGADEYQNDKVFKNAVNYPLENIREDVHSLSTEKPIVVHCNSGYRSSIGSSIIHALLSNAKVYDMGEHIELFK